MVSLDLFSRGHSGATSVHRATVIAMEARVAELERILGSVDTTKLKGGALFTALQDVRQEDERAAVVMGLCFVGSPSYVHCCA